MCVLVCVIFGCMCASVPVSECVFGCALKRVCMVGCVYISVYVSECSYVFSWTKDECVFSDVHVLMHHYESSQGEL